IYSEFKLFSSLSCTLCQRYLQKEKFSKTKERQTKTRVKLQCFFEARKFLHSIIPEGWDIVFEHFRHILSKNFLGEPRIFNLIVRATLRIQSACGPYFTYD
ncbi:MAG: hypothetical protein ACK56F_23100, partial [bacterium]